jgi:dTDP-4-amino-4,6-dideoxygalactose transaminase
MTWVPAICGGEPAFPAGPPGWRPVADAVRDALVRATADGTWNQYRGPNLAAFVERFAALLGVPHVLPCSSGTIATEIALRGVGVGAGDEVLLGAYDYPGNFRAIEAVGATPVLVDVDPATLGIDVEQCAAACGERTKAVVATHLHGGSVDMPRLCAWARDRGMAVVEDTCQAVGATIAGRPAGTWGDACTFSFGGSKLLTAGRGGAVVTSRADVAQRGKIFCERGNNALPLSELQATVLLPQLDALADFHARRSAGVREFFRVLRDAPMLKPLQAEDSVDPAYYKVGFWFDAASCGGIGREQFATAVRAEGIALDVGFAGFVLRGRRSRRVGELPVARRAAGEVLVLHHPLTAEPISTVVRAAQTIVRLGELLQRGALSLADIPHAGRHDVEAE